MSRTIYQCPQCGEEWSKPHCPKCADEREAHSLHRPGYPATQQLDILCEVLKNITNGTTHLHEGNFDHAALDLEVAASKLRTLENAKRDNDQAQRRGRKKSPASAKTAELPEMSGCKEEATFAAEPLLDRRFLV